MVQCRQLETHTHEKKSFKHIQKKRTTVGI